MKISKFGAIQYFMGQSLIWEGLLWFALGRKVRVRVGLCSVECFLVCILSLKSEAKTFPVLLAIYIKLLLNLYSISS